MAGLAGEFQTDLTPPDVLTICVDALDAIGWEIDSVTERRIEATAKAPGGEAAVIRIDIREADGSTEFRIAGVDSEDLLAEEDLGSRIEQADEPDADEPEANETEEREREPDPGEPVSEWVPAPEPERRTAVAQLPVEDSTSTRDSNGRPADERSWWDRNCRAVAIGLLVFCVGGGVGAAASGGGGDAKTVKRAAGKGQGASQKVKTEVSTVTETQEVEAATTEKTSPDSSSSTTTSASATPSSGAGPASPAAPSPPRVAKCDPGYAPQCLDPSVSDYDCAGQGDGPYYVEGPVTVIGNDRFKLDTSDHDGVGCE